MAEEKQPLLRKERGSVSSYSEDNEEKGHDLLTEHRRRRRTTTTRVEIEEVYFKRHISLGHAIAIIVGGVAGSGIFIAPTGVTTNIGSVGASLLMWVACGLSHVVLALCYAELGTALPLSGGDYTYIHVILGPLPAFLCLWITLLGIGPAAGALMARTVALYLLEMAGLACHMSLIVLVGIALLVIFSVLNARNVLWSMRFLSLCSVAKLLALGTIIIMGIIHMVKDNPLAYEHPFAGTVTDIGSIVASYLPGFLTYVGWDCVNTLVEEIDNPSRNLPLSVIISLILVTAIYVLTNMAYFSVLSVPEFIASDAVAISFAAKALAPVQWIIPIVIALSASGSTNAIFLVNPRFAYAGAKDGQLPAVLSYLHVDKVTPTPAIVALCIVTILYVSATFLDIQGFLAMLSVVVILKQSLTLVSLLALKWKHPDIPRSVKVHPSVVILCLVFLLAVLGIAIVHDPVVNGTGAAIFVLGIPAYYAGRICASSPGVSQCLDHLTIFLQRLFRVVPSS